MMYERDTVRQVWVELFMLCWDSWDHYRGYGGPLTGTVTSDPNPTCYQCHPGTMNSVRGTRIMLLACRPYGSIGVGSVCKLTT